MNENKKIKWVKEEPMCELIYLAGNTYPSYIQCSLFEIKKFKLVDVE